MIEAISPGDLVWVPSAVSAHASYAKTLITKEPRNFLVTSVRTNHVTILIDGEEWTVKKRDVFLPKGDLK
tara:strand:- start:245 stop:454 length:210 start_codon:yes stop_codon:yes gene_type:complete